jgi:hypothetical protein
VVVWWVLAGAGGATFFRARNMSRRMITSPVTPASPIGFRCGLRVKLVPEPVGAQPGCEPLAWKKKAARGTG